MQRTKAIVHGAAKKYPMPQPISSILGTPRCRFILNTSVDSKFIKFIEQSGVTWNSFSHRSRNVAMATKILHIMMPLDSYCKNLDGAVHLNFLWTIMCFHLLLIFVNWCILCGGPWMPQTMFSLVLHYALIFSLVPLFLEGGVKFSFNF